MFDALRPSTHATAVGHVDVRGDIVLAGGRHAASTASVPDNRGTGFRLGRPGVPPKCRISRRSSVGEPLVRLPMAYRRVEPPAAIVGQPTQGTAYTLPGPVALPPEPGARPR